MLLDIANLTLELPGTARPVLNNVSLRVASGEVVGLVGESGSGKSTTAKAALRTLPDRTAVSGSVRVDGTDVLALAGDALRRHRARTVAMVHQDPRSALNPVRRIGDFLVERLTGTGLDKKAARTRAVELLGKVGLSDPERRFRQRPHELSGGMLQRVVIAGALAAEPRLLLADEATSALDVTTQAEILALLRTLRADRNLGLLFITHDLQLAAAYCDRVYVMYAGRVVEEQPAGILFDRPRHPYTKGLLACSPTLGEGQRNILPIPGRPPSLADAFGGCEFTDRCPHAEPECSAWRPEPVQLDGEGTATCRRLPVLTGPDTEKRSDR
ncbi:ABC transporter ATP-binding protein [Streptomyces sp. Ncost-T10-10d]|uniref:ABC transporter ATP-binding protein n=1 Tax=Streptomyces sp. Ncost-T10-10d TaxID=1839774 RepID=UPI00081D73AD|nr:ABC transporter ATP-binding protein [Streptomyces sp. Ncost-T10-10d]SCF82058.1 oligopeptide/dipeptide ABC transporter, ATP-binding protein, C-terminal domain-containing protein [Streptomyces sp. Ncost-T10-10d]